MRTAVDTNIFADVLTGEPRDASRARQALVSSVSVGSLYMCAICYAELARWFPDQSDLDTMLSRFACEVREIDRATAFLAGQLFEDYRQRGGEKARILADFLVTADALLNADRLLTRDTRFFGVSFPSLLAVSPQD